MEISDKELKLHAGIGLIGSIIFLGINAIVNDLIISLALILMILGFSSLIGLCYQKIIRKLEEIKNADK